MSQGPIDPIRKLVSERITRQMYLNNRKYWDERGNLRNAVLQDEIVNLLKECLEKANSVPIKKLSSDDAFGGGIKY